MRRSVEKSPLIGRLCHFRLLLVTGLHPNIVSQGESKQEKERSQLQLNGKMSQDVAMRDTAMAVMGANKII